MSPAIYLTTTPQWEVSAELNRSGFITIRFINSERTILRHTLVFDAGQFLENYPHAPPPLDENERIQVVQAVRAKLKEIPTPEGRDRLRDHIIHTRLGHRRFFTRRGDGWYSGHVYIYTSEPISKPEMESVGHLLADAELCSFDNGNPAVQFFRYERIL